MIAQGAQIFVALHPIDMRWGFDRLAGAARAQLGYDARCGALFVFFGKRRTSVKVLFADSTGMCVLHKRIDHGTFRVPEAVSANIEQLEVDQAELDALLDGLEIARRMH